MEEILLVKIESIEKCLERIEQKLRKDDFTLEDYDTQDIIVLNLQRACQQSIDLAMFIVAEMGLGMPRDSGDAFEKLFEKGIITESTLKAMKSMVGFGNVAVHQYQKIDYKIVEKVIREHLGDFRMYNRALINKLIGGGIVNRV